MSRMQQFNHQEMAKVTICEVIDAAELAARWRVPKTWVLEQTRSRASHPLPCIRLGRYVRFEWGSPELLKWWAARKN